MRKILKNSNLVLGLLLYFILLMESAWAGGGTGLYKGNPEIGTYVAQRIKQPKNRERFLRFHVGMKAPDFEVKDLDGKELSLSQYRSKWVLLDFWASWCGPCLREMPNVLKVYNKYHDKGLEIIGISLDRRLDSLKKFIKKKNIPWRQYFDANGWGNKVAVQYRIRSIPFTILINPDGVIVDKKIRGPKLEKAIIKHLQLENVDKK